MQTAAIALIVVLLVGMASAVFGRPVRADGKQYQKHCRKFRVPCGSGRQGDRHEPHSPGTSK